MRLRLLACLAAVLWIAACDLPATGPSQVAATAPSTRLPDFVPPQPTAIPATASPNSNQLRLYYAQRASAQRAAGRLQQSPGAGQFIAGPSLAAIFKTLAFRDEFDPRTRPLQRWDGALNIGLQYGPSVTPQASARLEGYIDALLPSLQAATGLPAQRTNTYADLQIYVVNEGERQAIPARSASGPVTGDPDPFAVSVIQQMQRDDQCLVLTYDTNHRRDRGVIVIREELPAILQLACIHEEISQALGLTNDSPLANPSIFNDDDQYATLTGLDLRLLQILYHPALRPGMSLAEAGPIIDQITKSLPQTGG